MSFQYIAKCDGKRPRLPHEMAAQSHAAQIRRQPQSNIDTFVLLNVSDRIRNSLISNYLHIKLQIFFEKPRIPSYIPRF
jgi:hypothetical protein